MAIQVDFQIEPFKREVRDFTRRQVPFAFSLAINATLGDTKEELVDELPTSFTIRSPWTEKGIRTKPAKKNKLVGIVGSKDAYMRDQTAGGTKTPIKGRSVAIPVKARPRKGSRTTRSKWPKSLIARGKAFIKETRSGTPAVFMRSGRKGRKLRLMWILKPSVKIEPRWPLKETLFSVVKKEWAGNAKRAWKRALASARKR